jgi:phosphoglycolate phosphatase
MKRYLLFDLDGTLTASSPGITACVQYALQAMGIDEPDREKLVPFIGPSLKDSFMKFYHMTESQAQQAVGRYRERFQDTGIYENELYDGIEEMLKALRAKGMCLAVASGKPQVYVERILEHFKIRRYFTVAVGSELDGRRSGKSEVIEEALRLLREAGEAAGFSEGHFRRMVYMIGDRRFDIEGAKAAGVESVGAAYGYGGAGELEEAKADYVVRTVEELRGFLLRGAEEAPKPGLSVPALWQLCFPFLLFLLVRQAALSVLGLCALSLGNSGIGGAVSDFLFLREEAGAVTGFSGNASAVMTALASAAAGAVLWKPALAMLDRAPKDRQPAQRKKESARPCLLAATATVGAVVGLNLLFELLGLTDSSAAYRAVRANQYSAAFGVGLLCYGVLPPVAEELLFRGILFNRMKRFLDLKLAVVASALCFGAYHGNMVQGVYGFLMGCLMAYAYVYFGSFRAPLGIHIGANLLAYSLSFLAGIPAGFVSWPMAVLFLGIGAGSLRLLSRSPR